MLPAVPVTRPRSAIVRAASAIACLWMFQPGLSTIRTLLRRVGQQYNDSVTPVNECDNCPTKCKTRSAVVSSLPRKRESSMARSGLPAYGLPSGEPLRWVPACAGMTVHREVQNSIGGSLVTPAKAGVQYGRSGLPSGEPLRGFPRARE